MIPKVVASEIGRAQTLKVFACQTLFSFLEDGRIGRYGWQANAF